MKKPTYWKCCEMSDSILPHGIYILFLYPVVFTAEFLKMINLF